MTELHSEKRLPPPGIPSLRLQRDNELCGIDPEGKKKKRAEGLILGKMQQVNLPIQKNVVGNRTNKKTLLFMPSFCTM